MNNTLYSKKIPEQLPYIFLLLLTIAITLIPFFRIGFSTGDDLAYYMLRLNGNLWEDALYTAKFAGRFYFLITKPLYAVPYIFDNFYYTKFVQYGTLLLSYILFSLVIRKIFKSKNFALITFLLLILATPVSSIFHMPFISYPFYFTFSFSLLLASLLSFLHYTENAKKGYLVFSVVSFAIGLLFYETYLIFLGVMVFYIFIRNLRLYGIKKMWRTKRFYSEIVPFVLVALIYVSVYFLFRWYHNLHADLIYDGSRLAPNFSFKNFLTILFNNNISIYPAAIYYLHPSEIAQNSLLLSGHVNSLGSIIVHAGPMVLINALIQCFLFAAIFFKMEWTITWKKIGITLPLAFLLSLSSHMLIGIADKYNASWYAWMFGYVTSYFSYFPVMLICAFVFYGVIKIFRGRLISKSIVIMLSAGVIFVISVVTGYTNDHLSRDYRHSQNKFLMMEELISNGTFDTLPDYSVIYAADLHKTASVLGADICGNNLNWSDYVYHKSGKKLNFFVDKNAAGAFIRQNPDKEVYTIRKAEKLKNEPILMVLSKLNIPLHDSLPDSDIMARATCNQFTALYYSPVKEFTLGYYLADSIPFSYVSVNSDTLPAAPGINTFLVRSTNRREKITSARFETDGRFAKDYFFVADLEILPESANQK